MYVLECKALNAGRQTEQGRLPCRVARPGRLCFCFWTERRDHDEKITSRDNPKVKYACKLADSPGFRRSEGRFFAEGRKLCPELAKGAALEQLFYTAAAAQKCPELAGLPGSTFWWRSTWPKSWPACPPRRGCSGCSVPRSILWTRCGAGGRYLALERVQDPGNVGTLIRSAAAFGFDGVILSEGCASPYAPKTLRASMGAAVRVPVIESGPLPPALARLRQLGIRCLAAALEHSEPLGPVPAAHPGGVCVVVGSEGQGLEGDTIAACDAAVRIP